MRQIESEDNKSLAGLTQNISLEPPLVPTCDLLEGIFEAQSFDASTTECVGLASDREFDEPLEYRRPEHRRKILLVTDEQPENIKESRIPKNTKSNTNWAVGVWHDWARERNARIKELGVNNILVNPNMVKTTDEELRCWFAKFVVDFARKVIKKNIINRQRSISYAVSYYDPCDLIAVQPSTYSKILLLKERNQ